MDTATESVVSCVWCRAVLAPADAKAIEHARLRDRPDAENMQCKDYAACQRRQDALEALEDGDRLREAMATLLKEMEARNQAWIESLALTGASVRDSPFGDLPLLLGVVEAVLKWHQPGRVAILGSLCERHESHRHFSITRTEADGVRACPDCAATVYASCTGCGPGVSVDACPYRLAITRELTGKEAGDA